jgi:hypothetical protein
MPDSDSSSSSSTGTANSRWKASKTAGALRSGGSSLMSSGESEMSRGSSMSITPSSYKRGGKIRKKKSRGKSRY